MEEFPQVDLIVATVGRSAELARLFESLVAQTYSRVRVLLVDQNSDDRLKTIVSSFDTRLSMVHLKSPPGLSRARSQALPLLTGGLVAFPDDDCWYPTDLLHEVVRAFDAHLEWDGLSVQARDGRRQRSSMLWDRRSGQIDRYNVWRRAISFSFFIRRSVVAEVGDFAEDLGLGAGTRWGSGEESDYLLRALAADFALHYEPSLFVFHESPRLAGNADERRDAYLRGLGHGEVLRRHGFPFWFRGYRVLQLAAGSALLLARGKFAEARYYFAMALGRLRGSRILPF